MRRRILLLLVSLILPAAAAAQTARVAGHVTDQAGMPIAGVHVAQKGSLLGTTTDKFGHYELRVSAHAVLTFTRAGYNDEQRDLAELKGSTSAVDVSMIEGLPIAALEVVGTRRLDRTETSTPVAVDIIDVHDVAQQSGQLDLNQLLQYAAPSFNATRQSGADGADHIDPASLRGLGPDQTLVLINGQRRHQSSLINIFGSRGRGNTGTDLNAIPVSAIDHIEILREGASAQYGSDAIAGVINIVLKSSVGAFTGELASGAHNAAPPSKYDVAGSGFDGNEVHAGANYGWRAGQNGFINVSGDLIDKGRTNRPDDATQYNIYRKQFGDAALANGGLFVNSLFPISKRAAFYAFGGANLRHTDAFAWTRDADSDRNVPEIYPNGFDPHIVSDIRDLSLSAGLRTSARGWNLDFNSTTGSNHFHYTVDKTLNASLLAASPTKFDAGGFGLLQNTEGVHATRLFEHIASGLNVAFGSEFRLEKYNIFAGEEASYKAYRADRPAGAQGFPGFQPNDVVDAARNNIGAFADLELDATRRLTVGAAARAEHYSDFGGTITAKLDGRFAISDAVALRGSVSSGFRAPSLAQIHFSSTFTDVVSGQFIDKVIAPNDGPITSALGIPRLKQETARSASAGVTARSGEFTATIDGYLVDIDNRIVLTGAFDQTDDAIGATLAQLNVGAAQFFTNAIDTRTKGIDVVFADQFYLGNQHLRLSLAGNFNKMTLGAIHTTARLAGKEDIYFGRREQAFLRASAPASKVTLTLDHSVGRFDSQLRITNFGRVTFIDWNDDPDVYKAKAVTDASVAYRLSNTTRLTIGAANLFNVYPSQQDTETETGGTWDAVQMGFSGAFYFARLSIRM